MLDWMLDWMLDGMLNLDGCGSLWDWMLDLDGFGSHSNFDWKQEFRGRQVFVQAVRRQNRLT